LRPIWPAKAAPDGYTLLIASPSSISVNPALNPKLGYSPKDLLPVTKITSSPLVHGGQPGHCGYQEPDLTAAARKKAPGKLNYATSGNGSAPHLGAALFTLVAGPRWCTCPYKGGALAIQSVMAGDTQLTFGTPPSVLPHGQAGQAESAMAVSTRERSPWCPTCPA
jgi:tripartite-type tricarboxylate transporter receptor subunit TctC